MKTALWGLALHLGVILALGLIVANVTFLLLAIFHDDPLIIAVGLVGAGSGIVGLIRIIDIIYR